jgi:hypothetical protein
LLQTLINGSELAAPWGVALAPASFGEFGGDLLVGNFQLCRERDQRLRPDNRSVPRYDPVDPGSGNTPGGLWALQFGGGGMDGDPNTLYFNDGIDGETHGLFAALSIAAVPRAEHIGSPRRRPAEPLCLAPAAFRAAPWGAPQGLARRQSACLPVKIKNVIRETI